MRTLRLAAMIGILATLPAAPALAAVCGGAGCPVTIAPTGSVDVVVDTSRFGGSGGSFADPNRGIDGNDPLTRSTGGPLVGIWLDRNDSQVSGATLDMGAVALTVPTGRPIVQNATAVPEPVTWLQFILGFGLLGGALRLARRRTPTARTA